MKSQLKIFSILCLLLMMAVSAGAEGNKAYWVDAASGAKVEKLELAADAEAVIRLVAELPEGKTLKAYSLTVFYSDAVTAAAAASADALLPPININAADGAISANSFDVKGVSVAKVSLLDVTVSAKSGGSISVMFSNFGASADDEFIPSVSTLEVSVK